MKSMRKSIAIEKREIDELMGGKKQRKGRDLNRRRETGKGKG